MTPRFTFRQLEYLVAVGEAGSVKLAAARLHAAPASISAAVAELESRLGVQLFLRRHSHGLTLTSGGRRVLDAARRLLAEAEALGGLAADMADTVRGPLRIGFLVTIAEVLLPGLRRRFETRWPEVRLSQHPGHQEDLLARLAAGEIDAALTYDLDISAGMAFEPFRSLAPYALLPAGHPLSGRASLPLADLAEEGLILLDLPLSRDYFRALFDSAGLTPRIAERSPDMGLIRSLVANGFGYTLANLPPQSLTAPDGGALAAVPVAPPAAPLRLGLVRPRLAHETRALAAFAAECRGSLADLLGSEAAPPA